MRGPVTDPEFPRDFAKPHALRPKVLDPSAVENATGLRMWDPRLDPLADGRRSSSANAANIVNVNRPIEVVVSSACS